MRNKIVCCFYLAFSALTSHEVLKEKVALRFCRSVESRNSNSWNIKKLLPWKWIAWCYSFSLDCLQLHQRSGAIRTSKTTRSSSRASSPKTSHKITRTRLICASNQAPTAKLIADSRRNLLSLTTGATQLKPAESVTIAAATTRRCTMDRQLWPPAPFWWQSAQSLLARKYSSSRTNIKSRLNNQYKKTLTYYQHFPQQRRRHHGLEFVTCTC